MSRLKRVLHWVPSEVPVEGETSSNVWYRIILTATDGNGLRGKDSVDVHPRTSNLRLSTDPEGLQMTLDGEPVATPLEFTSVEGLHRTIAVSSPQEGDHVTYTFESWSDGNTDLVRTIETPDEDLSYTARFLSVVSAEQPTGNPASFPNPSHNGSIWLRDDWKPPVTIRMVDMLAREVARATWTDVPGSTSQLFTYGKVQAAIYSLIIEQAGSSRVVRIQVRD